VVIDRAAGIVAQPHPAELATHRRDVGIGRRPRVLTGLHGVLLGGQTERVVTHGVDDVVAGHPLLPGEDIGADVTERVANMQPRTTGYGNMSKTYSFGRSATASNPSLSSPTGLGARKVPPY